MRSNTTILDQFLAAYEQRAVTRTADEIERQRADISLGQNLGRIQGARPSSARIRLVELVILGKATPREVMSLGAEIARRGLFTASDTEHHASR